MLRCAAGIRAALLGVLVSVSLAGCGSAAFDAGPSTPPAGPAFRATPATPSAAASPTRPTASPSARSPRSAQSARSAQSPRAARPGRLLGWGDTGPAVMALQRRLAELHYWVGTATGGFDDATQQAVFALQKAAGISRDGIVGPHTRAALERGVQPLPRSRVGHVVEIDLSRDLLLLVDDGRLQETFNTSTGGGYQYLSDGQTAVARTPEGRFAVQRQVDGMVVSPLGELWRPKYFSAGYAIHGATAVPAVPVSHGCVRVSNEAIDWIWATGAIPLGTAVWVYR